MEGGGRLGYRSREIVITSHGEPTARLPFRIVPPWCTQRDSPRPTALLAASQQARPWIGTWEVTWTALQCPPRVLKLGFTALGQWVSKCGSSPAGPSPQGTC